MKPSAPSSLPASLTEAEAAAKGARAGPQAQGQRLDQWLAAAWAPEFSRARIQNLIRDGHVRIDGERATAPNRRLGGGEWVSIDVPEAQPPTPLPQDIPLDVLYEDDALIVISKPAGLVVHPGAGNPSGTLVNALLFHCGESLSGIGGVKRPGIVHRLDKDTSGVMVAAKTDHAHRALAEAFADHGRAGDLERAYLALVWGAPERDNGVVDASLGRDRRDPTRRAVVAQAQADARHAVTRFRVEERFHLPSGEPVAALVECRLETGRTHQIRVHMAHLGFPVIGDPDYGKGFRSKANKLPEPLRGLAERFGRQALHARLLAFRHPETNAVMRFEAPLPADMADLAAALRGQD